MCGIAGVLRFDGQAAKSALLEAMSAQISHRGPDDQGLWIEGPVGMAHRRLSILDLSTAARQPMVSRDRSAVLVFNGEIYNFKALREQLMQQGSHFTSTGDTEVLFEACRVWGVRQAARLANGMFAFAYWDVLREELWLARDRLGIKPLYFHCDAARFLFASEIKALLPDVDARPDMAAVMCLLNSQPIHDPYTPFDGVRALEAGQVLCVRPDGAIRRERFFRLEEAVDENLYRELDRQPHDEVVERFDGLIQRSVDLHLASDAQVAAMVSGGLDSSLIAHLTKQRHPSIAAYHANVQGPFSELGWAEQLAKHSGMPLHVANVSPVDYIDLLAESTLANECPLNLHPNTVPFLAVCRLASKRGVKVLLTGEGADELFAGYAVFPAYRRKRKIAVWRDRVAGCLGRVGLGRWGRFLVRSTTSDTDFGLRSRSMAIASLGRALEIDQAGTSAYEFVDDPIERETHIDLFCYLRSYLQSILWRNDRMGMAAGIESRVPFLENELIRHAVNLPIRHKLGRGGVDKKILREVADRHLPSAVSRRAKMGFPVDADRYAKGRREFFENGFLAAYLGLGNDEINRIGTTFPEMHLRMLLIEIWGQIFFIGRDASDISAQLKPQSTQSIAQRTVPAAAGCN